MNLAAIHGICAFFVYLSFDQNVFFYMYMYIYNIHYVCL